MTVAATFEIRFTRYLQPDGREAADLPSFAADPRALVPDYRAMVFMRALDAKAVAMQRTGQFGPYAATSKGDCYESLNAAGVWQLPMVVVAVNNQYAISVPRHLQSKAKTLAQKAIAAGIDCEQLDGNDLIAVRDTVGRAVEKARTGGGPTLLEALTYRLSDHTTADDATRYRSAEEVAEQWQQEPIVRLRTWLHAKGAWSQAEEQALAKEAAAHVPKMVQAYLETPPPGPEQMFEHLYARLPRQYAVQLAQLAEETERDVEHH